VREARTSRRSDTHNLSDELSSFHGIYEELGKIGELHGRPFLTGTAPGLRQIANGLNAVL